jgi:protein-tyrosine-phosphatase
MDLEQRATAHAALGDETRLRIVDSLWLNDMSPHVLARMLGIDSNLLAHHLGVLEAAGVVERINSAGDGRRRYIAARWEVLGELEPAGKLQARSILFVCTHNSARSQFAEALVRSRSSLEAQSAGNTPSETIHPKALRAAGELGVDLSAARPKPYADVSGSPDLVVSVCDRAGEAPIPFRGRRLHWSIPDPVDTNRIQSFRNAFDGIATRVHRLIEAIE